MCVHETVRIWFCAMHEYKVPQLQQYPLKNSPLELRQQANFWPNSSARFDTIRFPVHTWQWQIVNNSTEAKDFDNGS
jgi:hypothetical protein